MRPRPRPNRPSRPGSHHRCRALDSPQHLRPSRRCHHCRWQYRPGPRQCSSQPNLRQTHPILQPACPCRPRTRRCRRSTVHCLQSPVRYRPRPASRRHSSRPGYLCPVHHSNSSSRRRQRRGAHKAKRRATGRVSRASGTGARTTTSGLVRHSIQQDGKGQASRRDGLSATFQLHPNPTPKSERVQCFESVATDRLGSCRDPLRSVLSCLG